MNKKRDAERNVLVTGGGGFLGKVMVRKLIERGDRVISFSRNHYPELDAMGAEQVRGDIGSSDDVNGSCRGIDVVFHVAAKAGMWGDYEDYYHTNVRGTENIINGCVANGVPVLVYTSTPSTIVHGGDIEGADESAPYPERFSSHYARTKAIAEQAVVAAAGGDLRTMILRPHIILGPGDNNLVPRLIQRADRLKRIGSGKNLVDTIYVDNAADAHLLAADKLMEKPELSGRIYFICQNEPVRLWDLINDVLAMAGKGPVKGAISHKKAMRVASVVEGIYKIFRIRSEPFLTRYLVHEFSTAHWFNTEAARRDLGFVPRISFKQGQQYLKEWIQDEIVSRKISA